VNFSGSTRVTRREMLGRLFAAVPLVYAMPNLPLQKASGSRRQAGPAAITAFSTRPEVWSDVRSFGAVGDGVTDDTAAVQSALNAGNVFISPGTYRITRSVTVPSNRWMFGNSSASVLRITGVDRDDPTTNFNAFQISGATRNILIEDLSFQGENDPYVVAIRQQSAIIDIAGVVARDITIRRCFFEKTIGFSVHNSGRSMRVDVMNCTFLDCGNGLNVNGDYSVQVDNVFLNSEGLECSGEYAVIANNLLLGSTGIVGISLGGRTTVGSYGPGVLCASNSILGSSGAGITVNDGIVNAVVSENFIDQTHWQGIVVSGSLNPPINVEISDNEITSAGKIGESISHRIGMLILSGTDHRMIGNKVLTGANDEFETSFGLLCEASRAIIRSNTFQGNHRDVSLSRGSEMQFGCNNFDPARFEQVGGATVASSGCEDRPAVRASRRLSIRTSLEPGSILAPSAVELPVVVPGAIESDVCYPAPDSLADDGLTWSARVVAPDIVTVRIENSTPEPVVAAALPWRIEIWRR
jgi:hypothetical protein